MNKVIERIIPIAVFFPVFTVYMITLAPDVTYTDTGELAAACITMGVAHPTGYPLFIILNYLWSLIPNPFAPIYWLNILTAIFTSLGSVVFYLSIKEIIKAVPTQTLRIGELNSWVAALCAALTYAFAGIVWQQGVSLEVYSLQILLINLAILLLLKSYNSVNSKQSYALLASFTVGLSFANHLTTILLLPGFIFLYMSDNGWSKHSIKSLLIIMIPAVIAVSLYILLPLRSMQSPEFDWGIVSRGWDKFIYHVSGKQYQIWMFSGMDTVKDNLRIFGNLFFNQFGYLGIIPLFVGAITLFRIDKRLFGFFAISIVFSLLYVLNYSINDIANYFKTTFTGLLLLTGFGMYYIASKQRKMIIAMFAIPIISLSINFGENDKSDDYAVSEYTRILTEGLDKDAVIISSQWDFWCSAFWYKQSIEGLRPDIALIEKELLRRTWYPTKLFQWYPEVCSPCLSEKEEYMIDLDKFENGEIYSQLIQSRFVALLNCFIEKNIDRHPIYITIDVMQTEPGVAQGYDIHPEGFAFRVSRKGEVVKNEYAKNIKIDKFKKSIEGKVDFYSNAIKESAAIQLYNIYRSAVSNGDLKAAKDAISKANQIAPELVYVKQGMIEIKELLKI